MPGGRVTGLQRFAVTRAEAEQLDVARFREDWGVDGDHHARAGRSRQVVLAEGEVLDELDLPPGAVREQLTIAGVGPLAAGTILEIGDVRLELVRPRVPCRVMDTVRPGLERELRGRGGWCARVLASGDVRVGDAVRRAVLDDPAWITDYLEATAEWEAVPPESRRFEPGWSFPEQFAHLIAWDERAGARIAAEAAGEAHEKWGTGQIDAFNAAALKRMADADLWDLHDKASTALVEIGRRHPEQAEPWFAAMAAHYRRHC